MGLTCFYKSSIHQHYPFIIITYITPSLSSHKQCCHTDLPLFFPLRERNRYFSLLTYVFFSPLCAVPHAAGSKAYGSHTRKVTKDDSVIQCRFTYMPEGKQLPNHNSYSLKLYARPAIVLQ